MLVLHVLPQPSWAAERATMTEEGFKVKKADGPPRSLSTAHRGSENASRNLTLRTSFSDSVLGRQAPSRGFWVTQVLVIDSKKRDLPPLYWLHAHQYTLDATGLSASSAELPVPKDASVPDTF
jgi:hypothetical protein